MTQFFDMMLDTETAGMPPDGALLSVGAVFFDLNTEELGPTFSQTIHLATSVRDGGTLEPSTFMFWLGQSEEARKAVRFGGQDIRKVLHDFSNWIAETCRHEAVRVWANSPNFDLSIVGGAYDRADIKRPWHWTHERDFRTVRAMYPTVEYALEEKGDSAHTALGDAIFQAHHLFKIKRSRMKKAAA